MRYENGTLVVEGRSCGTVFVWCPAGVGMLERRAHEHRARRGRTLLVVDQARRLRVVCGRQRSSPTLDEACSFIFMLDYEPHSRRTSFFQDGCVAAQWMLSELAGAGVAAMSGYLRCGRVRSLLGE